MPKLPKLVARLEAGAAILDVGCGAVYAMVEFATRYPHVRCVGVDVEPTSIAMALPAPSKGGLVGPLRMAIGPTPIPGVELYVGKAAHELGVRKR